MSYYLKISAVLTVAALVIFTAGLASAQVTLTVDTLEDRLPGGACNDLVANDCALRDAISLSNATPGTDDTINFDPVICTAPATIELIDQLGISDGLSINGDVDCLSQLTIDASKIVGPGTTRRVFYINSGADLVIITRLNLTGGSPSANDGGAIFIDGSTAEILDNTISGNSVTGAGNMGGGIFITDASGNVDVLVEGNTITGNSTDDSGGGIYIESTGNTATVTVGNNTITGNTASRGGGIFNDGVTVAILNSTISGNTSTGAGAASVEGINTASLIVQNSIIADDTMGVSCSPAPGTQTNNIDSGTSCGWSTNSNSKSDTDPLLGSLGDYGGPNPTLPLLPGSPAINNGATGPGAGTCTGGTDQRYNSAVGNCDIGAFESQGFNLSYGGGDNQSTTVGTPFPAPLVVDITAVDPVETVNGGIVEFTPVPGAAGAGTTLTETTGRPISAGSASLSITANTVPGAHGFTADTTGNAGSPIEFTSLWNAEAGSTNIFWRDDRRSLNVISYFQGTDYTGVFERLVPSVPFPWIMAAAADFNLDGHWDILWNNPMTRHNAIAYYQGLTLQRARFISNRLPEWRIVGTGDSNKDGYPDIYWYNTATTANEVWYMRDGKWLQTAALPNAPSPWIPLAVGDFNNDMNPDIVARNGATGRVIIAFLNPTRLLGRATLPAASTGWNACGTIDMSGDNLPDLVWHDPVTGASEVWIIENGARSRTVALPNVPPPWSCMAGHK